MRSLILVMLGIGLSLGAPAVVNTAQIQLHCLSLKVEPGVARQFGLEYTLAFSSADFLAPNGELFPIFEPDLTHGTQFRLDGPEYPEPLVGQLVLYVPEEIDDNTNGVPDVYEVAAEFPGVASDGFWGTDVAGGGARFVWNRAAGERRGTCTVRLTSTEFGDLPEFTHAFEVIEYGGDLTYEPGSDPIHGSIDLRRAGLETNRLQGPLVMTREPTNRFHQFTITSTVLTNEAGALVPVAVGDVASDTGFGLDYFGALRLEDGDPETPEIDYDLYYLTIVDPNDVDGDGIPDLTDDPEVPPPGPPSLSIARDGDQLRLLIVGEVGVTYTLQRAPQLKDGLWETDRQVTLSATNEVLVLPLPETAPVFCRLSWP